MIQVDLWRQPCLALLLLSTYHIAVLSFFEETLVVPGVPVAGHPPREGALLLLHFPFVPLDLKRNFISSEVVIGQNRLVDL